MYLFSKIEEVVALLVPENAPLALPPPLDETGIIIMRAAQLLRKHGWTPGAFVDVQGHMCAVGAVFMAITGNPRQGVDDRHPAILRIIGYLGGSHRGSIESWNDKQASGGPVIDMLERAARYVR